MSIDIVSFEEGEAVLDWLSVARAIEEAHRLPRPIMEDVILRRGPDTLLNRSAWIDGLGIAVKAATVFPGNGAKGLPTIGGAVNLMSDEDGTLEAVIDFALVTKWKTAGDSLLGALKLARPDSHNVLIVGAGTVARTLVDAYGAGFPGARFTVWSRTRASAEALAAECPGVTVADDLEAAVRAADIVTTCTMATEPIVRGDWLRPGTHLDMIGAYRPDMREADDAALARARLFCDSRKTAGETGEFLRPIESGAIGPDAVVADLYEIDAMRRGSPDEITLYKNGGGAHLDLMVSRHVLTAWRAART
ncbi:Ornithine cyclodeaminase [Rubellimicrobium mesophilum DSM 19309]|uniref:Ornithine cyclodeaminase n=1 Tax=Rubellimicrobium mesophilum DSM 19309 TaxID=442562 RepID=A0A017HKH3_9RHOB|nr:ornithine cyclodeaminase [Rubellimicrobium mesophilum]EYD74648.1 Ornithine cyclodeaminase [Rubellimicrobium mesophilum DSM 19309]